MAVLWSNPNPGPTPAELTAHYQVHAPEISGVLNAILRQRLQQQQQMQSGIEDAGKGIAGFMQQRKADQVAQTLLDQASNYDNETPTDYESMARTLNESDVGAGDAWKALQTQRASQIKESLAQSQIDQHKALADHYRTQPTADNAPVVDPDTGMVWNGSRWVHPARSTSVPRGTNDPLSKALEPYGATKDDLDSFVQSGQPVQFRNKDGTMNIDENKAESNSMAVINVGGKTLEMPHAKYQKIRNLYGSTQPQDSSLSTGSIITEQGTPEIGTRRTIKGVLAEWDGQGWKAVGQ